MKERKQETREEEGETELCGCCSSAGVLTLSGSSPGITVGCCCAGAARGGDDLQPEIFTNSNKISKMKEKL